MNVAERSRGSRATALLNPAWWAWNEQVWGVQVMGLRLHDDTARDVLEGAVFLGRNGRIVTPPLNPHLPVAHAAMDPGSRRQDSLTRAWVGLADGLAEVLATSGMKNSVVLPTGLMDARPFSWAGLRVGVSYTYVTSLPRDESLANRSVAKRIRKARSLGYFAERSDDWTAILSCLEETESSKGFRHRLSLDSMRLGAKIMGPDCFRGYVVRESGGRVVSGGIRLHAQGHRAVDWVQGTSRSALADGVNQLMYDFVMEDLHEAGATSFDLAGASIREVAAAKASWGYPLVPQLTIGQAGLLREAKSTLASSPAARGAVLRIRDLRGSLTPDGGR